jgi:hypothetical protein
MCYLPDLADLFGHDHKSTTKIPITIINNWLIMGYFMIKSVNLRKHWLFSALKALILHPQNKN